MATFFAQAAGAIQSIEWDTAPTGGGTDLTWPPAADDVLCANGKAITWAAADVPSLTCARLSTTGEGTGTAGGRFTLSGSTAVVITADIVAGAGMCLYLTHTAGMVTVNGDLTGGTGTNDCTALSNYGTGSLTVNANTITGGGSYKCKGLYFNNGTVVVNATTIQAGAAAVGDTQGILGVVNAPYTISVTATNIIGGAQSEGIKQWGGTAAWDITCPNIQGGAGAGAHGLCLLGTGVITINGNVTGGSAANAYGLVNSATGAATVIGSLIDTEQCGATAGKIYWRPVAGVHYHKVFHSAGAARYYTHPPAQTDVRDGIFAGFSEPGVAYNGNVVLPSAGDVRLGVDFDYPGKETGTLHLPAVTDVKTGVGYGTNATEFTGTLAAGGGGVPLIGPGGLVG